MTTLATNPAVAGFIATSEPPVPLGFPFEGGAFVYPDGGRWAMDTDEDRQAWMAGRHGAKTVWTLFNAQGVPQAMIGTGGASGAQAVLRSETLTQDPYAATSLRTSSRIAGWLTVYEEHLGRTAPPSSSPENARVTLVGEAWEKAHLVRTPLLGGRFLGLGSMLNEQDTALVQQAMMEAPQALATTGLQGWAPGLLERNRRETRELQDAHNDRLKRLEGASSQDLYTEKARQREENETLKQRLAERTASQDGVSYREVDAVLQAYVRGAGAWLEPSDAATAVRLAVHWSDTLHGVTDHRVIEAFLAATVPEAAAQAPEKAQAMAQDLFHDTDWIQACTHANDRRDVDQERAIRASQVSSLLVVHGADGPVARHLFDLATAWSEPIARDVSPYALRSEGEPDRGLERCCPWASAIAVGHADWAMERLAQGGKPLGLSAALSAIRHDEPLATVQQLATPWLVDGDAQVHHRSHRHFLREALRISAAAAEQNRPVEPYAQWLLFDVQALSESLLRNENLSQELFALAAGPVPEILDNFAMSRSCRTGLWREQRDAFDLLDRQHTEQRRRTYEASALMTESQVPLDRVSAIPTMTAPSPESLPKTSIDATTSAPTVPPVLRNLKQLAQAVESIQTSRAEMARTVASGTPSPPGKDRP